METTEDPTKTETILSFLKLFIAVLFQICCFVLYIYPTAVWGLGGNSGPGILWDRFFFFFFFFPAMVSFHLQQHAHRCTDICEGATVTSLILFSLIVSFSFSA